MPKLNADNGRCKQTSKKRNKGDTRIKRLLAISCACLWIAGCQSTPTGDIGELQEVNRYSTSDPKNNAFKATDPDKLAEVRTRMAAQHIRENQLGAAKRQLEKAFDANQRYAPAYDMMGVLLQKEGSRVNLQKAEKFFVEALKLDPEFMQARNNYGVYLSQMGRNQAALAQFEIAAAALGYEGRVGALENLGHTAIKLDNMAMASQAFIRVLEVDRNNLVAHIELVDLLIKNDRITQAQDLYDETLAILGSDANKLPRILLQGIKLANAQKNLYTQEKLSQQLLADFPLSEEAKKLKGWIRNSEASWK